MVTVGRSSSCKFPHHTGLHGVGLSPTPPPETHEDIELRRQRHAPMSGCAPVPALTVEFPPLPHLSSNQVGPLRVSIDVCSHLNVWFLPMSFGDKKPRCVLMLYIILPVLRETPSWRAKKKAKSSVKQLQERISPGYRRKLDGSRFARGRGGSGEGGGGGAQTLPRKEGVSRKAGVNFSSVHGIF